MMNKKRYFYLNPYVYIKCNEKECIVTDTQSHRHYYINHPRQVAILSRLYDYGNNNYYVTALSDAEVGVMAELSNQFEQTETGGIVERNENDNQPVIIPPVIRVSNQLDNYDTESTEYLQDIKSYVYHLHICLNAGNGRRSPKYFDSYKQFESPKYTEEEKKIDYDLLIAQLDKLDFPPQKIILSGSNIFHYSHLQALTTYLFAHFSDTVVVFLCDIEDYIDHQHFFKQVQFISARYYIKVFADMAIFDANTLLQVKEEQNILLNFMVTTTDEVETVLSQTEKHQIQNFNILPYYDGRNLNFFKEHVFLEKDDILTEHDIFEIASKEVLNKQLFGHVYIDETGNITLNPNTDRIGNIGTDNLYFSVYKSFAVKQHKPWFLTREEVQPCKQCIFSKLCPSISNYELFLNKFNFCNIVNDEKN